MISTFSGKPLFGYRSMVAATLFICLVSFTVWLHHFFTMGAGADVNAVFGIATSIIAVGTGVKVYNWIFTMFGGRIRFATPMLWSLGFLVTFVIGGMTGVLLAVPPADFQLHNSLFLVAHFHNVIIGGVLFAAFAGMTYWFPKAFGFRLHEGWGKAAFWLSLIGFYVVFMPLYVAGLLGMTRRLQHYDVAIWRPWMLIAGFGILIMVAAAVCQVIQLVVSIRRREELRDETGDPWDGRSLEWSTASPPPAVQFRRAAERARRGAVLAHQAPRHRAPAAGGRAALPGDRDAAQQPDRVHHGLLLHHDRLRADLAHLVAGRRRPGRRLCGVRLVRLARREEYEIPAEEVARTDRARRPRASGAGSTSMRGASTHEHGNALQRSRTSIPIDWGAATASATDAALRDRPRRGRAGIEARDRRLRVLDFPAERHRDVLGILRRACGAADRDRRRALGT